MGEEKNVQENPAQPIPPYNEQGPGYGYMGNEPYYNRRNAPYMNNQGYGYNMGPAPRGSYRTNYPPDYNRGNYGGRYYGAPYGRPYGEYEDHEYKYENKYESKYEYDDHYDHGYYYNRSPYMNRPYSYSSRIYPYGGRPYHMGGYYGDHHYDHHYYHDNNHMGPYAYGYGPYQKPGGFLRNWLSYNPVTNWVRGPQGSNFLRGLGVATAAIILAPAVVKTLRPLAMQAVHGAMSIVGEVKGVVADAREELEDIFADAKWENLNDKEGTKQEGV